MKPFEGDPLVEWRESNRPNWATTLLISRWLEAAVAPEEALQIEEQLESWHRDRSLAEPDLVACVAWYGYGRLLIQGWTRLPIKVPDEDLDRWRGVGYEPTIADLQGRIASAAGGFLELAGLAPDLIAGMIVRQVHEKLSELEALLERSVDQYTPRTMTPDEIIDGADAYEQDELDKPFALRQQLDCFEWGFEKLRMLSISVISPELDLPNRDLHDALLRVDLNDLLDRLGATDVKLRKIWQNLARHDYYKLNSEISPDSFWWRHWKGPNRRVV